MEENIKPSMVPIDLGEVVEVLKDSEAFVSYECKLCKDKAPHMVVMMSKGGDIHVHAPFENKFLMNQFAEAIIREQNKYNKK